jgi:hypothetical protein
MQQQWKDAYPGLLGKLISNTMLAVGRDVEQGSYSALYAATSPEIEEKGYNGYYFADPVSSPSFILVARQFETAFLGVRWILTYNRDNLERNLLKHLILNSGPPCGN